MLPILLFPRFGPTRTFCFNWIIPNNFQNEFYIKTWISREYRLIGLSHILFISVKRHQKLGFRCDSKRTGVFVEMILDFLELSQNAECFLLIQLGFIFNRIFCDHWLPLACLRWVLFIYKRLANYVLHFSVLIKYLMIFEGLFHCPRRGSYLNSLWNKNTFLLLKILCDVM